MLQNSSLPNRTKPLFLGNEHQPGRLQRNVPSFGQLRHLHLPSEVLSRLGQTWGFFLSILQTNRNWVNFQLILASPQPSKDDDSSLKMHNPVLLIIIANMVLSGWHEEAWGNWGDLTDFIPQLKNLQGFYFQVDTAASEAALKTEAEGPITFSLSQAVPNSLQGELQVSPQKLIFLTGKTINKPFFQQSH